MENVFINERLFWFVFWVCGLPLLLAFLALIFNNRNESRKEKNVLDEEHPETTHNAIVPAPPELLDYAQEIQKRP